MPTNVTWNGVAYSIPLAGELNWASLSDFLLALGNNAAVAEETKQSIRKATSSPVTVAAASDYAVVTDLAVAGAVTVNLPAGVNGQIFVIVDGKGDAATNNITINRNGAETIKGSATLVLDRNRQAVALQYNSSDTDWKVIQYSVPPGGVVVNDITGTLSASKGGTGVANNAASTLTISGNFGTTLTVTNTTALTLPLSGTVATLADIASASIVSNVRASEGAGTTTLTNSDVRDQTFNLSAARNVDLPTTGVTAGAIWTMRERTGSFALQVRSSAGNNIQSIRGSFIALVALVNTPTTAANWAVMQVGPVYGTQTNNAAQTGYVGEVLSAYAATVNSTATNTFTDITSLTFTAGDWDLNCVAQAYRNSSTFSPFQFVAAVASPSGNTGGSSADARDNMSFIPVSAIFDVAQIALPPMRVISNGTDISIEGHSYAATQTLYLKGYLNAYSAGTPYYTGVMRARRVR